MYMAEMGTDASIEIVRSFEKLKDSLRDNSVTETNVSKRK